MQDRYSPEEIAFMSTQLRELSSLLMGNAHTIYGITPEGTRNEDGILTKARTGLGRLEQYHTPSETFYLPVGLIYPPHAEKNTIEVGKPILLPDSIDFSTLPLPNSTEDARHRAEMITDELMRYLAQLLPEESRGYYGT